MKVSDEFPSQFLEAAQLNDKPFTGVVERVEKLKGVKGRDGRPFDARVVYFKGAKKGWCVNRKNAKIVRDFLRYGDEMEGWIGKPITIYPTTCDAFGDKDVPCIRVKVSGGEPAEVRK
jgi:hypothetical protein